jgi:selT/selW/selH-like putative selenoprotein
LTGKLVEQFKTKLKGVTLIPDRGGCFEITVDDELIYSKLKTDEFPREAAILDEVGRRLRAAAA